MLPYLGVADKVQTGPCVDPYMTCQPAYDACNAHFGDQYAATMKLSTMRPVP